MNANFGIVLRKSDRESFFLQLPPRVRTWGQEVFAVGEHRYIFPGLDGVEFEIYPVTKFIRSKLPVSEQPADLEYAWMTGHSLDKYQNWVMSDGDADQPNVFEKVFIELLSQLGFWAVMLAPEGDRLEAFVYAGPVDLVAMLRKCLRDLTACDGFLAIGK
ncbi:hypothetical protein [Ralstonia pseudosolanacearum]|uniref:Uncharacterized protein n=1 Tax=Ralstonia solanacearum TaxID=305 RepID=A0AA92JYM1_RALSL|nr:hypothetical protein [Ralstonia pseudosolanacearum]QOK90262.1 hypothetical protein HF908_01285 [Ralstonia pseudosolanacearum]QOK95217.1 hypothetical protein HF909_01275 [Ralstonia pseudosolanacearum]UWD91218.1 hypothetical protein NY025_09180 [Ralstonia pseudosolanacearum]